jgi:hypothetical protein
MASSAASTNTARSDTAEAASPISAAPADGGELHVAAQPLAQVAPAHHRHRHRRDPRRDDAAGQRMHHQRQQHRQLHRQGGDRQRRRGRAQDRDAQHQPSPLRDIHEGPARHLRQHGGDGFRRQHQADLRLRPALAREIGRHEGAEGGAHAGHAGVQPVQPQLARRAMVHHLPPCQPAETAP